MKSINWGQIILIAVMATAVPVGFLTIAKIVAPDQPWLLIVWLGLATAIETISTTLWLRHRDQLSLNKSAYRAAEFMVLAILTRLFAWFVNGNWPQTTQWQAYLLEPSILFDSYYIVALIIVMVIWSWTITLTQIFHHLEISPAESNYYAQSHSGSDRPKPLNRVMLVETFFQNWLWGGIFLIICAALTTYDLTEFGDVESVLAIGRLGLRPELLTAILSYFLSGLWLLSQARLSVMRARWLTGRVVKQQPVEKSWRRTSFITLATVAGLATLLPIGSTNLASRILGVLFTSLIFLFNFIILLFGALIAGLLSLLGSPPPTGEEAQEPFVMPQQPLLLDGEVVSATDSPSLIIGSIFWLVIFVLAIIAFVFFLRERGYRLPTWRQIWQATQLWWQQWRQGIITQIAKFQRPTSTAKGNEGKRPFHLPFRFLRLNALSPRDQIRYFYLSTVRRASERGAPRQDSDTPLEYANELRHSWPEAAEDVTDLTQAFLKVRYRPDPVSADEATAVKSMWKRLRAAIKQKKS